MTRTVRAVRIEGDIAYVTLTKGYTAIIDACDAELIGQYNWCAKVRDHTVYAHRSYKTKNRKVYMLMHRLIVSPGVDQEVDHIDHNGLNNTRSNLRVCDRGENSRNMRKARKGKSKLKGITWNKRWGKWYAQIMHDGKYIFLGSYDCEHKAHEAYREACKRLHKEYGFPGDLR